MRRLFVLLMLVAMSAPGTTAWAQGMSSTPSPEEQASCLKAFIPLREDAERKGKMIKVARERHSPAEQTCKLINSYHTAEVKMIKYLEANSVQCGTQPSASLLEQLKAGHRNTEGLRNRTCALAQRMVRRTRTFDGPASIETAATRPFSIIFSPKV
jgi:hypothetical protein